MTQTPEQGIFLLHYPGPTNPLNLEIQWWRQNGRIKSHENKNLDSPNSIFLLYEIEHEMLFQIVIYFSNLNKLISNLSTILNLV